MADAALRGMEERVPDLRRHRDRRHRPRRVEPLALADGLMVAVVDRGRSTVELSEDEPAAAVGVLAGREIGDETTAGALRAAGVLGDDDTRLRDGGQVTIMALNPGYGYLGPAPALLDELNAELARARERGGRTPAPAPPP